MQEMPENMSPKDFLRLVYHVGGSKTKIVCVKFTAAWCSPCKHIQPYLEDRIQWVKEFDSEHLVLFYTMDIDKNLDIYRLFSSKMKIISGVPAFLVYERMDLEKAAEDGLSVRDYLFPKEMVLGANINEIERIFRDKINPLVIMATSSI